MNSVIFFQLMTYKLFCSLNRHFFENSLLVMNLKIRIGVLPIESALAQHSVDNKGSQYIFLNPKTISDFTLDAKKPFWFTYTSVLLHEMIHYACDLRGITTIDDNGVHNESFRNEALKHGLTCERDNRGWNITWIDDDPSFPRKESSRELRKIVELYGKTTPYDRIIFAS